MMRKKNLSLEPSPAWGETQTAIASLGKALPKALALMLLFLVWGCSDTKLLGTNASAWRIYENHRYGFQFPYPSNWQIQSRPSNDDGVVLRSPEEGYVEIRAWASQEGLGKAESEAKRQEDIVPNFQTQQGKKGVLVVETTPNGNGTVMKLKLKSDKIIYYWQGRSSQEDFEKYYRFFYYIARNYQVIEVKRRL